MNTLQAKLGLAPIRRHGPQPNVNRPWLNFLLCLLIASLLAACGSSPKRGGYYKDDGPHASVPSNLDSIPDAVPRVEPYANGPNRPYVVFGKQYVPDTSGRPYNKRGTASWYGKKFHGQPTSNGDKYDMYAMTAAHPTLPIPSYARVTRTGSGRSVIVRINDRGPFHEDRIIDLSYAAAHRLELIGPGSGEVMVEWISPDTIGSSTLIGNSSVETQAIAEDEAIPSYALAPAAPPLAAVAATTSIQRSTPGLFLQLGAFSAAGNAQAFMAHMQTELGSSAPLRLERSDSGLYRVRLGPYPHRPAAEAAAQDIQSRLGITPSIALQP